MLWLGSTTFFVLGIVLVLLGVHQAEMARDLGLDLAAFGLLGAVLALGVGVGVTVAGPLVDRLPRRPLYTLSCALAGLALVTADPHMSHARAALHLGLLGLGCGGYVTLLNAAIFERHGERAAPALALMHASATAGAASGPWLIALVAGAAGDWQRTFLALGALYLGLAVLGALVRMPPGGNTHTGAAALAKAAPAERLRSVPLVALAMVGFAYVGVENGLTLFAVPWGESQGLATAAGRSGISAFWLGLLSGRVVLALQRRSPNALLLAMCGAAGALVICTSAWRSWPLVATLGAAGLALGPVYPLMMALTGRRFASTSGTALGLVGGAGALGGFVLPWLAGMIGDALAVRFAIGALGSCALLIVLAARVLSGARAALPDDA